MHLLLAKHSYHHRTLCLFPIERTLPSNSSFFYLLFSHPQEHFRERLKKLQGSQIRTNGISYKVKTSTEKYCIVESSTQNREKFNSLFLSHPFIFVQSNYQINLCLCIEKKFSSSVSPHFNHWKYHSRVKQIDLSDHYRQWENLEQIYIRLANFICNTNIFIVLHFYFVLNWELLQSKARPFILSNIHMTTNLVLQTSEKKKRLNREKKNKLIHNSAGTIPHFIALHSNAKYIFIEWSIVAKRSQVDLDKSIKQRQLLFLFEQRRTS